ncbi:unnamed protein product [Adineta steineri]|uniref:HMG box domain-containing protein n=1 Tax=Adineta steineri TaxID=433720 RepID=A0A814WBT5_9BILA|nr:unnamed protein product [Adineta steineri]CAF3622756.1 unnamed protein product [Adineta steineri]
MNMKTTNEISQEQQQIAVAILDEYCRYYSDFSKILGVYIKNLYPNFHFQFQQLLDASYNIWHRLSNEDKISLATFLEDINRENHHPMKIKTFNGLINSNSKSIVLNTNSYMTSHTKPNNTLIKKRMILTPYHIYLKDERKKFIQNHSKMSIRDINKRLYERWQKLSNRMKYKYEYRSYLAKKRLYKKQGKSIQLKKPSFIKRMSSKTVQRNK